MRILLFFLLLSTTTLTKKTKKPKKPKEKTKKRRKPRKIEIPNIECKPDDTRCLEEKKDLLKQKEQYEKMQKLLEEAENLEAKIKVCLDISSGF